jgi:hypothetical protein
MFNDDGWSLWLLLTKSCSSPSRSQCLCPAHEPIHKVPISAKWCHQLAQHYQRSSRKAVALTGRSPPASVFFATAVSLAWKRGWQPSSPEPSPAATLTTSMTGHLNVHPASRNSTISPEAQGEDQGMAPGRYFCIADCTYLCGWKPRASCVRLFLYGIKYDMNARGCFLLMAAMSRHCELFTPIYGLALFSGVSLSLFSSPFMFA